jgi:hypothetical protein
MAGLLGAFLGNMANEGANILEERSKNEAEITRAKTIAEHQAELRAKEMVAMEEIIKAREGRAVQQRRDEEVHQAGPVARAQRFAVAQGTAEDAVKINTGLIGSKAAAAEQEYTANEPLQAKKDAKAIEDWKKKFNVEEEAKKAADIARTNDPKYLAGLSKEARAKHIDDGAGLRAKQIEALELGLKEKKQINDLVVEFETTKDPARKAQVREALIARGVLKSSEFDTEKVTEEKIDEKGNVIKTERTQKRQAGGGAQKQTEQEAHAEAKAALATGKITPEEVNKRLRSAGFAPIGGDAQAAPAAGGRPYLNTPRQELERMSKKPRGVSSAEAADALAELEKRKGESRMGTF